MKKILITGAVLALLLTGCQSPETENNTQVPALQHSQEQSSDQSNELESLDKNHVAGVKLTDFKAVDLEGNTVNGTVFKESKLTVLNLWGTFCGPCIDEMPDLQELSTELKDKDIQVLGIVTDGENADEAKRIVDQLGVTYKNILPDEQLQDLVVNKFDYVPATLFVNQEGTVLETFIPGGATKETFKELIERIDQGVTSEQSSNSTLLAHEKQTENSEESDETGYDAVASLEQVLGMDMEKLSADQLNILKKAYDKIEAFEFKEDGSNEEGYYELLENFDYKMKKFGLKVPYYNYMEYADDHKDKISKVNYMRLEKLNNKYLDMMESGEIQDEEAYENVVASIELIFKRSGLPGEEVTAQVENRNVHYARFDVKDGHITYSADNVVKKDQLTLEQKMLYARLWAHIEKIVPTEYMKLLTRFEVNTDGYSNVMAHVVEETEDYSKWRLAIDLKDSVNSDGSFSDEFTNTVIHEFAHVMTLHKGELQGENVVDQSAFSTQEGYLKTSSYLNKFYQRFWLDIAKEHDVATEKDAETGDGEAIYDFYDKYEDQFVSDYAATNPGEDIAETYRVFVMEKKPTSNSIRDQKILFMYEFDELVKIRQGIRLALNLDK